jgi:sulfur carrier protein
MVAEVGSRRLQYETDSGTLVVNATVNGEPRTLPEGTTLHDLLCALDLPGTGIAVAVNDLVVRRASFCSHTLADGDAVEIIRAVAGG